jgi:hypothetical protein
LRLLLDEHYSQVIAERLRDRGHDVTSVNERPDFKGLKDHQLFPHLPAERFALVTENWADFDVEMKKAAEKGMTHYGVVFTSAQRMPRSRNTIGLYVRVLDEFLSRHPAEDALLNSWCWLP